MKTFPFIAVVVAILIQAIIIESNIGKVYYTVIIPLAFLSVVSLVTIIFVFYIYNRFLRNGKK